MSAKLGLAAKLFRYTGTARAAWPTSGASALLHEVTNVKDLGIASEKGEADTTTRAALGWETMLGTLKKATIDFDMVWDDTDTDIIAFASAHFNNTQLGMAALSGGTATTSVQGLWADFEVLKFEVKQELREAQKVSISLKPGYSAVPPAWITIA